MMCCSVFINVNVGKDDRDQEIPGSNSRVGLFPMTCWLNGKAPGYGL